jgi:probable F420-dependent oxidoreductase
MCVTSVEAVAQVADSAEELGFDGVSVQDQLLQSRGTAPCGRFHDGDDRDIFEPLATLSFVAARTSRVKLVTGVIVLPFRHVVQLAKAAGTIDVMSNGRLVLGVGIGWPGAKTGDVAQRMSHYADVARRESELFMVPSPRPKLMDEALQALHLLWTDDVATFHGDLISFEGVDLRPQPVQRPRPPIWFGAWAEPAIRRASRLGEAWLVGPSANLNEIAPCARLYQAACREMGKSEGQVAIFRYVFVASSTKEAISTAGEPFIQAFERMYFRWPHPVVKRPAGQLTIERLAEDRIILGDPITCVNEIIRFRRDLGAKHLVCRFSVPGISREACQTSLDLFTREVMPALRA